MKWHGWSIQLNTTQVSIIHAYVSDKARSLTFWSIWCTTSCFFQKRRLSETQVNKSLTVYKHVLGPTCGKSEQNIGVAERSILNHPLKSHPLYKGKIKLCQASCQCLSPTSIYICVLFSVESGTRDSCILVGGSAIGNVHFGNSFGLGHMINLLNIQLLVQNLLNSHK